MSRSLPKVRQTITMSIRKGLFLKERWVLNLAIRENNPSKVERMTRDIDGDRIGELPTMGEMERALRSAVKKVDDSFYVRANIWR